MLESLNKVLENNDGNRHNHSHFLLQRNQAYMDLSFSLLFSTLRLTLNISF